MTALDPRIDSYIARAPAFATGILTRLRALVHQACPDAVETMKWRMPFFEHHGPLCFFAAFTGHCSFGVWRKRGSTQSGAIGRYGRFTAISELPPRRELIAAIHQAMARNRERAKAGRRKPAPGPPRPRLAKAAPVVPADLTRALAAERDARREFAAFSPGKQRDYIDWLEQAKRPQTRAKRLATAIGWISAGKERNWKYQR